MVSTRRKANFESPDPEMESYEPAPKSRRTVKGKTPANASTVPASSSAPAPAPARQSRRLRGAASASPLQSLAEEKRPKRKAHAPVAAAAVDSPLRKPAFTEESPSNTVRDRSSQNSIERTPLNSVNNTNSASPAISQTLAKSTSKQNTPKPPVWQGRDKNSAQDVSQKAAQSDEEEEADDPVFVQIENIQLQALHAELAEKSKLVDQLIAERDDYKYRFESLSRMRRGTLNPLEDGEVLLRRIEDRKHEIRRKALARDVGVQFDSNAPQDDDSMDVTEPAIAEPNGPSPRGPATPTHPSQSPAPSSISSPQASAWGFKSLLGRVASVFRSPVPPPKPIVPPATAPPKTFNSVQAQEIGESLAAFDTPTRAPAKRNVNQSSSLKKRTKRNSKTMTPNNQRTRPAKARTSVKPDRRSIISRVTRDVQFGNEAEKNAAMDWVTTHTALLSNDSAGDKRKRLDEQWKMSELKEIPASKPWQTGSFGLLDEFFDSDEDDVPEWAKLAELTKEEPPLKKRKTDFTTPSPNDFHPRKSTTPSPMFETTPSSHSPGTNMFVESPLPDLFPGGFPKGFSVPDDSSSDISELTSERSEDDQAWTQAPPPPPAPAHASLPVPLTTAPSVPAMPAAQASMFAPEDLHDPVKAQRLQALKHTPAKSSRLREMMIPSPSLGSVMSSSPPVPMNTFDDMPDAIPLDLGDDELLEQAKALYESAEFQAAHANDYGGAEVMLTYDYSDEEESSLPSSSSESVSLSSSDEEH